MNSRIESWPKGPISHASSRSSRWLGWNGFSFPGLGVQDLHSRAGVVLLACPTAFPSYLLSTKLGADKSLRSSDLGGSTLLFIISLSFRGGFFSNKFNYLVTHLSIPPRDDGAATSSLRRTCEPPARLSFCGSLCVNG